MFFFINLIILIRINITVNQLREDEGREEGRGEGREEGRGEGREEGRGGGEGSVRKLKMKLYGEHQCCGSGCPLGGPDGRHCEDLTEYILRTRQNTF